MSTFSNPRSSITFVLAFCAAQVVTATALADDHNNKGIPNQIKNLQKQIDALQKQVDADEIVIVRDDFEDPFTLTPVWNIQHSAGAQVFVNKQRDILTVVTEPTILASTIRQALLFVWPAYALGRQTIPSMSVNKESTT